LTDMKVGEVGLAGIATTLREQLTDTFKTSSFPTQAKRLTLVIAGFRNNLPIVGFISNQEAEDFSELVEPTETFRARSISPGPGAKKSRYVLSVWNGATDLVSRPIQRRLRVLRRMRLFQREEQPRVAKELVFLIRCASLLSRERRVIGRSCMSVTFMPGQKFHATYHPSSTGPVIYMPHFIGPSASMWNIQMWRGVEPPADWWRMS